MGWLLLLIVAFHRFFFASLSTFEQWATFDGSEIANQVRGKPNSMVHWQSERCICNKYSESHIQNLTEQHETFLHIRVNSKELSLLDQESAILSQYVPATPAVMIFDNVGNLAYFGPYSGGAVCGSGEDFVASTVNALDKGVNPSWINQESVGCLCPWQTQPLVASLN